MSEKNREETVAKLTELLVKARERGDEELAGLIGDAVAGLAPKPKRKGAFFDLPDSGPLPDWVKLPESTTARPWAFPRNVQAVVFRFLAEWTRCPEKGDRVCVMWELDDGEERVALLRAARDPNRAQSELAKQMIRVVDGHPASWTGVRADPGSVEQFWAEIGAKCRTQVVHAYNQIHVLSADETDHFLDHCVAVVSAV